MTIAFTIDSNQFYELAGDNIVDGFSDKQPETVIDMKLFLVFFLSFEECKKSNTFKNSTQQKFHLPNS